LEVLRGASRSRRAVAIGRTESVRRVRARRRSCAAAGGGPFRRWRHQNRAGRRRQARVAGRHIDCKRRL